MARNEEFREFVLADAQAVSHRQETDSIPIIDDIRYHIENCVGDIRNESFCFDRQSKFNVVNKLLTDLGLEA